ncbi:glucuronate isomerase [Pseudonocardia sp. MH-G8]|uniref:glucuronate isomerase n=1 Tax=Pseudonocardia sp. MH-G8 TaxID=1854588 RepID=UPI000BA0EB8D|nr:glucuronate isomerase [Pseudonocardia sp. MH-G8]OZM81412.1 glucuronate isomerase [Pseudonocardia sp. MH-G8]
MPARPLELDDNRILPTEPAVRAIAREIFAAIRDLPLISMHGHVEASVLADDAPFGDPAQLLVVPDHYVTRMFVSQGTRLEDLGVPRRDGGPVETDGREIWRRFCAGWRLFRGTPSRFWLEQELHDVFGVQVHPSVETADAIYDRIAECIAQPQFRPRALFDRFGLEILATTDAPSSSLEAHAAIAASDWDGRVVPTFRPDALVHLRQPRWKQDVEELGEVAGTDVATYAGYLQALEQRREHFRRHGALATDHGHICADTTPLERADAERIYAAALAGTVDPVQADAFAAHMLFEMARMSRDDGLVMQIHPGVLRNHDPAVHERFGPDKGFDIPLPVDFVRGLRPMLSAFGTDPGFRCVVFTIDEDSYSRELAPLAGVYPAMRLGVPWWFLDSPLAMRRFREAVTETAGFYNTAGFVDDTRAFASIPARHELARRVDSGYLAQLVANGQLGKEEAIETAVDLTATIPRQAYAPRAT